MIYTSYFGALRHIDVLNRELPNNKKLFPVSISVSSPVGVSVPKFDILCPPYDLLQSYKKGATTKERYTEVYQSRVLDNIDPLTLLNTLVAKYQHNNIVLLCWEKSGDFCHRNQVRDFLTEGDIMCNEISLTTTKQDILMDIEMTTCMWCKSYLEPNYCKKHPREPSGYFVIDFPAVRRCAEWRMK